jgi:mannose/fructose/N-acetylgalactosamine-specific phosphotransferase system component IID
MSTNKKELTPVEKKNIWALWRRSGLFMGSMNPVKRQNQGYCYSMIPIINQIYKNDEPGRIEALKRSNEFINTHACPAGFILGLNYALEKEKAEKGTVDGDVIRNIKTSLMGPFAGIGDSIFFMTSRVIAAGIGIGLASQGSVLGALLFIIIYGGSFMALKYPLIKTGYIVGTSFIQDLFQKGLVKSLTKAAGIVGLLMVGCMAATLIRVSTPLVININDAKTPLQNLFDGIMPSLLPLITLFGVYKLLKKKFSVISIVFMIIGFCIVMSLIGLL